MSWQLNQNLLGIFATVLWLAYFGIAMPWIWSHISLANWMSQVTNSTAAFYCLASFDDLTINFVLALPIALIFLSTLLNPWRYVTVASLVGFLWMYRLVLSDMEKLAFFVKGFPTASGMVISIVILPLAVLALNSVRRGAT